jgi:hypothetical protein
MTTPTCLHTTSGLCPACQADYDADPEAWLDYGDHPAGVARTLALWAELAAEQAAAGPPAEPDPTIPF